MDALTSKIDNHFNHNSIETNGPITGLPRDISLFIFSFLSFKDLSTCCCVNSLWNRVTKLNVLYQPKNQQDVIDDFIPLVNQSLVTWKEVRLYARLSKFLAQCMQKERCVDDFIKRENPNLDPYPDATFYIPKPFVKYGNYLFSISYSTDIKICQKEKDEPTFLVGKKGKDLFYLMVEGNNLFAVRQDGVIIQWDYIKKEKINKIQTIFSKKKIFSRKSESINKLCPMNSFYVKNGLIVIIYKEKEWSTCEIIDYINPEKTAWIECPELLRPLQILIEKDKIFIVSDYLVCVLNRLTHKSQIIKVSQYINDYVKNITLNNHILFVNVNFKELHVFNLRNHKEKLFYLPIDKLKISEFEVLGNLLFGFSVETKQIVAINLNTKTLIKTVPCDFNLTNIEFATLNELVGIVRKNLDLIHLPEILKQEKRQGKAKKCTIS